MKLLSYAKVNLYLNVLFKRQDGYHEIDTLFERIGLADEITLTAAKKGIKITTNSKIIPKGPKNLAYRAAKLLKDKYKIEKGLVIHIQKDIPVAAGLGGGSSNAAAVLMGLNKHWNLRLSRKKLIELGSVLGSDVPFFLLEEPLARGTGRGEILKKIHAPRIKIWHCLIKPSFGISTKKAYQSLDQSSLTPKKANVKMLLHSIQKGQSSVLEKLLTNSLEGALNKRVTEILEIKKLLLRHGACASLLSGSGPTVFGIFSSQKKALAAASFFRKHKGWQVFVASTASRPRKKGFVPPRV